MLRLHVAVCLYGRAYRLALSKRPRWLFGPFQGHGSARVCVRCAKRPRWYTGPHQGHGSA